MGCNVSNIRYEKLDDKPDETKTFFGRLTFGFLSGLIKTGNTRPLEEADLSSLELESTQYLTEKLVEEWEKEIKVKGDSCSRPRLWSALLKAVDKKLMTMIVLLAILNSFCRLIQPVVLSFLLEELTTGSSFDASILCLYSALLCFSSFVQTFAVHHATYATFTMAVQVKASLIGLVYKKIMITKHHILADKSSGYAINLITKDMIHIHQAISNLDSLTAPIEILVVFCLLWKLVGWQTFGGVVFSIILIAYQTALGNVFKILQEKVARLTDRRLRLIYDVVSGIRVLKMNAWEWCFRDLVSGVRRSELNLVYKKGIILAGYTSAYSCYPIVSSFVSLFPFLMDGNHLTPQNVFTTLALLGVLQKPVTILFAYELRALFQATTTLKRIESFLFEDNSGNIHPNSYNEELGNQLQCHGKTSALTRHVCNQGKPFLCLNNVHFRPRDDSNYLNMCISDSRLIGITGPVGCGKTSLFHIIIGEVPSAFGQIAHQGRIAYVCQTPWVFSGTVRENILFGKKYNHGAFQRVLDVCSLKEDLDSLSSGDMTHVGERGVSLSGGQRARVNLARAVYSDADIYLLDDPLSAVDAKVSNELFERCICGALSDRIRLFITHQSFCLQKTDLVLLMGKNGTLSQGTFKELCESGQFSTISSVTSSQKTQEESMTSPFATYEKECVTDDLISSGLKIEDEDRLTGSVSYLTYWKYLTYGVSKLLMVVMAVLIILPEGAVLASSFWLAHWTKLPWQHQQDPYNVYVYVGLAGGCLISALCRSFLSFHGLIHCSSHLHTAMLTSLLKSPVRFFDANPAGRILNRFANDIGCMDEVLPYTLLEAIQYIMFTISILVLVSVANVWVIGASVPFVALSLYLSRRHIRAAREIKRIEAITSSPVCTHVADTIQGITTIHIYKRQEDFIERFYSYQDRNSKAWYCYCSSLKWVGLRLDILSSFLLVVVTLAAIFLSGDAALSGLSISYCLQLTTTVQWMLQAVGEAENYMTSVERVLTYAQLPPESGYGTSNPQTPERWPEKGSVTFKDVSLRYYKDGPSVLKGINFGVSPGEKIGIVGRTGAGKSSLLACLLRMPANTEGEIIIDGMSVADLNVQVVRSAIAVIPQNPFLFNDALRRSLDPADKFADEELWNMLEKVQLKPTVENREGQLNCHVTEHGTNFSVGERQLICFARALLFGKKIIVMDEATSSVDNQTDELIQKIIRKEMIHCTVITIAHRLSTVIDYDRIMVLDGGKIVEMDSRSRAAITLRLYKYFIKGFCYSFFVFKPKFSWLCVTLYKLSEFSFVIDIPLPPHTD
ncbi:hypothetical protein ACROYT_G033645 [Oculina patagonica]